MRVVIHSASLGTLLYHAFDMALFSTMHQPIDQAMTFADEAAARAYVETIKNSTSNFVECFPEDLSFPEVATSASSASIEECVAAGVPGWQPSPAVPYEFNFHARDVGHTVVYGAVRTGKSFLSPNLLAASRK
ncbi:hypothetical protein [Ralstonia pickettii]|uniref:Uncharacterized protein n=1 Tax=Ralstonia pickettii TaxID=329 RepID=A0AAW4Q6P2_RALPI|nr:hypothetical protein [Ralstonia pickettii]MBA9846805.1 hypothetical protein [Ralstonia pickettii]MBA9852043.1 hypothetical protein [Ralstonia pickettii]MBA9919942.1 hypothetical protein [Ralstonia pickettii]MBA9959044.1 hypothetical protein [Ralstonia pickettii]MBA9964578.1 hypothetical protein [Ralstonia pickettii]